MTGLIAPLSPPDGWALRPLRYLAQLNPETLPESHPAEAELDYIDIGAVGRGGLTEPPERMTFSEAPSRARRVVRDGDILVSTVRTYLRAVMQLEGASAETVASTGFAALRPGPRVDGRFLYYWCLSDPFVETVVAKSKGVSYPAINASELLALPVALPSLEVQRRVAEMLDAETTRMDTLMERTREARRVLHLRGRGYRETLVAKHDAAPLRYYVRGLTQGSSPNVGDVTADRDEPGLLRLSSLRPGEYRPEHSKAVVNEDARRVSDLVRASRGMVLVSRANTPDRVGDACLVDAEPPGGRYVPDLMFALETAPHLDPAYLASALTTRYVRGQMEAVARGSSPSMVKLRQDDVLSLAVPMPSLSQQREIVRDLRDHDASIREVDVRIEQQQELLRMRRQALITAAVTGQITV